MKAVYAFLLLVLSAAASMAIAQPAVDSSEVLHGTGLKWGMTQPEIEQALHAKIVHGKPHMFDEFTVPDGSFAGFPAKYTLGFGSTGRLEDLSIIVVRPDDPANQPGFDHLVDAMSGWYGKPLGTVTRGATSGEVEYTFWNTAQASLHISSGMSAYVGKVADLVVAEPRVTSQDAVTVTADALANLKGGSSLEVRWARLPVVVVRRSQREVARLQALAGNLTSFDRDAIGSTMRTFSYRLPLSMDEPFVHSIYRSQRVDIGVYLAVSTDTEYAVLYKDLSAMPDVQGIGMGFYDPCHGHSWDSAGWLLDADYKFGALVIPRYHFEPNGDLVIGR